MEGIVVTEFGDPEVLRIQKTIPLPDLGHGGNGSDEILIKIYAIGVNPVDTYIRSGSYKNSPVLPYIPGKDGAGIVHKIGNNVKHLKIGDRVYFLGSSSGSYAQYAICHSKYVYHLPDEITFEQGACLGTPAFTAYRALFEKGHATPGERLFIHGASGGVGLMVLEMAKAIGVIVIGTAGTSEGIQVFFSFSLSCLLCNRQCIVLEQLMSSTTEIRIISKRYNANIQWVLIFV
jgi:NADPH:quinone reductase